MTILIVDDSLTIRAVLRAMVESMGHSVLEATDGQMALDVLQQERPDLVLMDVVMPVMDGHEAARRMRAKGPDDWVPIIFLSSTRSSTAAISCSVTLSRCGREPRDSRWSSTTEPSATGRFPRIRLMSGTRRQHPVPSVWRGDAPGG